LFASESDGDESSRFIGVYAVGFGWEGPGSWREADSQPKERQKDWQKVFGVTAGEHWNIGIELLLSGSNLVFVGQTDLSPFGDCAELPTLAPPPRITTEASGTGAPW